MNFEWGLGPTFLESKMQVKPFSPGDATASVSSLLPDEVISAVNRLLSQKFDGRNSVEFYQHEVIKAIKHEFMLSREQKVTRAEIFENQWLDFEPVFRKSGWRVYYDKPGYNESYEPTFTFTPNA